MTLTLANGLVLWNQLQDVALSKDASSDVLSNIISVKSLEKCNVSLLKEPAKCTEPPTSAETRQNHFDRLELFGECIQPFRRSSYNKSMEQLVLLLRHRYMVTLKAEKLGADVRSLLEDFQGSVTTVRSLNWQEVAQIEDAAALEEFSEALAYWIPRVLDFAPIRPEHSTPRISLVFEFRKLILQLIGHVFEATNQMKALNKTIDLGMPLLVEILDHLPFICNFSKTPTPPNPLTFSQNLSNILAMLSGTYFRIGGGDSSSDDPQKAHPSGLWLLVQNYLASHSFNDEYFRNESEFRWTVVSLITIFHNSATIDSLAPQIIPDQSEMDISSPTIMFYPKWDIVLQLLKFDLLPVSSTTNSPTKVPTHTPNGILGLLDRTLHFACLWHPVPADVVTLICRYFVDHIGQFDLPTYGNRETQSRVQFCAFIRFLESIYTRHFDPNRISTHISSTIEKFYNIFEYWDQVKEEQRVAALHNILELANHFIRWMPDWTKISRIIINRLSTVENLGLRPAEQKCYVKGVLQIFDTLDKLHAPNFPYLKPPLTNTNLIDASTFFAIEKTGDPNLALSSIIQIINTLGAKLVKEYLDTVTSLNKTQPGPSLYSRLDPYASNKRSKHVEFEDLERAEYANHNFNTQQLVLLAKEEILDSFLNCAQLKPSFSIRTVHLYQDSYIALLTNGSVSFTISHLFWSHLESVIYAMQSPYLEYLSKTFKALEDCVSSIGLPPSFLDATSARMGSLLTVFPEKWNTFFERPTNSFFTQRHDVRCIPLQAAIHALPRTGTSNVSSITGDFAFPFLAIISHSLVGISPHRLVGILSSMAELDWKRICQAAPPGDITTVLLNCSKVFVDPTNLKSLAKQLSFALCTSVRNCIKESEKAAFSKPSSNVFKSAINWRQLFKYYESSIVAHKSELSNSPELHEMEVVVYDMISNLLKELPFLLYSKTDITSNLLGFLADQFFVNPIIAMAIPKPVHTIQAGGMMIGTRGASALAKKGHALSPSSSIPHYASPTTAPVHEQAIIHLPTLFAAISQLDFLTDSTLQRIAISIIVNIFKSIRPECGDTTMKITSLAISFIPWFTYARSEGISNEHVVNQFRLFFLANLLPLIWSSAISSPYSVGDTIFIILERLLGWVIQSYRRSQLPPVSSFWSLVLDFCLSGHFILDAIQSRKPSASEVKGDLFNYYSVFLTAITTYGYLCPDSSLNEFILTQQPDKHLSLNSIFKDLCICISKETSYILSGSSSTSRWKASAPQKTSLRIDYMNATFQSARPASLEFSYVSYAASSSQSVAQTKLVNTMFTILGLLLKFGEMELVRDSLQQIDAQVTAFSSKPASYTLLSAIREKLRQIQYLFQEIPVTTELGTYRDENSLTS